MHSSLFKDLSVSRGFQYHYYVTPPAHTNPVILFLHGFPCSAHDWRHQVAFFKQQGYGVIAPDMLGYGGTAKPTDPVAYTASLICNDIVEILDAENAAHVIVVGHDWGCKIASRLANFYPDRFDAFAFLAVGYMPPRPGARYEDVLALTKKTVGYELFGYWSYLAEDGAAQAVESNFDSFFNAMFPEDPKLWISTVGPTGGLKSWVAADKKAPGATYLTDEEKTIQKDILLKGGLTAPFCWYKVLTSNIDSDDDRSVPTDNYNIHKPVFFGAAKTDYVALPAHGKGTTTQYCKNTTVYEFDTSHWVMLEARDEVNQQLLTWIQGFGSKL